MNERDAQNNGYNYCGPTIGSYPRAREIEIWEKDLQIAKLIKKTYQDANYVIVNGSASGWLSRGSKAIYGNENFNRLWSEVAYHDKERRLTTAESRRADLIKKFEAELAEFDQRVQDDKDFLAWMESLKKVK